LQVTGTGNRPVIDVVCKASDLREIQRFCEAALRTLETDGGRIKAEKAA
jgi:hypothetical protein